jgi:predicted ATPase/DNA-binding SARP family transcriptional activator
VAGGRPLAGERPAQSLYNLRRSLSDLRGALGDYAGCLVSPAPHTLRLELPKECIDVALFDALIARGDEVSLRRAVSLYRGPLLEDCAEEWALPERAARERAFLSALDTLSGEATARGDAAAAVRYARLAAAADPLSEPAHRRLFEALAACGDYAGVTQGYRDLRLRLHRELNASPSAETVALFQHLRSEGRAKAAILPRDARAGRRAAATIAAASGAVPHPISRLIGREREMNEVRARLDTSRLVTLTGAGGVGKTRLAVAVAREVGPGRPDGARFVDLSAVPDPARVPGAVVAALGVREDAGRGVEQTLVEWLWPQCLLLVLDNCEHLLDACARLVGTILAECGEVQLLATSREPMGLRGEVAWRVPSMSVPTPAELRETHKDALDAWLEYDALQLFVARAAEAQPAFQLSHANLRQAAEVCCRLDGIPLAIELAASRLRAMSVDDLAARLGASLGARFGLLAGGPRTAVPRQQTLRATLDWSHDLLAPAERVLYRRLGAFAGSFSLEAVEAVCGSVGVWECGCPGAAPSRIHPHSHTPTQAHEAVDFLTALVDKSMVQYEPREVGARYRLLETLREYACERLEAAGETAELRKRHLEYFLALAEEAEPELIGPKQANWLTRLDEEHDNLRAALEIATVDGGLATDSLDLAAKGLRLAVALARFWAVRGYPREGLSRLRAAIEITQPLCGSGLERLRARALYAAGRLALPLDEHEAANAFAHEAMAIGRRTGDEARIAEALDVLGNIAPVQGDHAQARQRYLESLEIWQRLGHQPGIATAFHHLGNAAKELDEHDEALRLYGESLRLLRELGNVGGIALVLFPIGVVYEAKDDLPGAIAHHEESLRLYREVGDRGGIEWVLGYLGTALVRQGKYVAARPYLEEGVAVAEALGARDRIAEGRMRISALDAEEGKLAHAEEQLRAACNLLQTSRNTQLIGWCLFRAAWLALRQQRPERAVRLLAANAALHTKLGHRRAAYAQQVDQAHIAAARAALSKDEFAEAWADGSRWTLDQALVFAAGAVGSSAGGSET